MTTNHSSPCNLNAYLNNPTATSESLDKDGWFHTGDVGKIDGDGNLWITDRLKEVIKVKGYPLLLPPFPQFPRPSRETQKRERADAVC